MSHRDDDAPQPQPPAARESLAAGLLIATPMIRDPHFARTVVLLLDHDGDGAFGVVLNRRAEPTLGTLLPRLELPVPRHLQKNPVWWGGPVQQEAGAVVYLDDPALPRYDPALALTDDLRVSWSMDLLRDVADGRGPAVFSLYLGSAGWGPGQLERELAEGAWIPIDLNHRLLFRDSPDTIWHDALTAIGAAPSTIAMGDAAQA